MELLQKRRRNSAIIISGILIFLFAWAHLSGNAPSFTGFGSILTAYRSRNENNFQWIPRSSATANESPARSLITNIRETTKRVAQLRRAAEFLEVSHDENKPSNGTSEGAAAAEMWNRMNPCRSRLELVPLYDQRKYAKKLPSNPLWEELFAQYSELHRTCLREAGNLTEYFLSGNQTTGCKFVVADIAPFTGLGNKIFVLVSSLLYSIVTQRVLLVPSSTLVTNSMCEPFSGSSWVLDSTTFPVPRIQERSQFSETPWTYDQDFFGQIDAVLGDIDRDLLKNFRSGHIIPAAPLTDSVGVLNYEWQPSNRFYCSAEQTFYSQATWVYLSGCIYTIPKIFATSSFRPILEDLFPDRMVMTRLLRSVFLPGDYVWDRVKRMDHTYLAGADRRVGIQVRYKDGVDHYKRMNTLVNQRISKCTQNYGILPDVASFLDSGHQSLNQTVNASSSSDSQNEPPKVKVFIASLFPGLLNHLMQTYVPSPTVSGEEVALVQISQDENQVMDSLEEDQQAFTEILLLSLSDQLMVTPISTFGGLAQAYGALTPWFIEMGEDSELESCQRGQTVDVCNQFVDKTYRCRHDPALNERKFSDVVPYIKDCLAIDHDSGIQLITTFQS